MTSTAAISGTMRPGLRLMRHLPLLALLLALASAVLLALGPLGWRAGWWHYRVGFSILMPWAAYGGLAAIAVALAAPAIRGRAHPGRLCGRQDHRPAARCLSRHRPADTRSGAGGSLHLGAQDSRAAGLDDRRHRP